MICRVLSTVVKDRRQRTEGRGQTTEDRRQRTDDRGQITEGRRQRTDNRGKRAEGRRKRTDDRGQRAEDRIRKAEDSCFYVKHKSEILMRIRTLLTGVSKFSTGHLAVETNSNIKFSNAPNKV